jgi:hypothetical protein
MLTPRSLLRQTGQGGVETLWRILAWQAMQLADGHFESLQEALAGGAFFHMLLDLVAELRSKLRTLFQELGEVLTSFLTVCIVMVLGLCHVTPHAVPQAPLPLLYRAPIARSSLAPPALLLYCTMHL